VPVTIRDVRSAPDRSWIQSIYGEYLKDLSAVSMNTGMFPVSGEFGEREDDLLGRWFADDGSYPLLILQNDKPVGFALVSRPPRNQRGPVDYRMAEFFVLEAARRRGLGRLAAQLIFRRFSGSWEITEFQSNAAAVAFWRAVVTEFTAGRYRESITMGEVRQTFRSEPQRRGG
jgi:predicted acetyltransferase